MAEQAKTSYMVLRYAGVTAEGGKLFEELKAVPAPGPEQAVRTIARERHTAGMSAEDAAGDFRAIAESSYHAVELEGKTETTFKAKPAKPAKPAAAPRRSGSST